MSNKKVVTLSTPEDLLAVQPTLKRKSRNQQPMCRRIRKLKVCWICWNSCLSDAYGTIIFHQSDDSGFTPKK